MMDVALILLAAGSGQRLATSADATPKQYRKLSDLSVIEHALKPFIEHPAINLIQPVIAKGHEHLFQSSIDGNYHKLRPFIFGGATRQISVMHGLQAIEPLAPDYVLIHDAARPFVPRTMLDDLINALVSGHDAVAPVLDIRDSLRHRGDNGMLGETVPRDEVVAMQTPQGGRFHQVLEAHKWALSEARTFTDDAALCRDFGLDVFLTRGAGEAHKLTTDADWKLIMNRFNGREERQNKDLELQQKDFDVYTGQGFDVHAFGPGSSVRLCGVTIPFHQGLKGHSDADVMFHALTDALLGAIGGGDIGVHFPPDDPQWKNQDSGLFLDKAVEMVAAQGGRIVNVDLTLIGEAPKLKPHRLAMSVALAKHLKLDASRINLKATTTERLGFIGRGEGLAALAVANIKRPSDL